MADNQEGKAPDMSEEELQILIDEYERRRAIIDSEQKTVDFGKRKNKAWEEITEAVNVCSSHRRTVIQVKTKMKNLKTRAKAKFMLAKRRSGQTGGGPPPKQLFAVEERLSAVYGDSAGWCGVPGGAESSAIPPLMADAPSPGAQTSMEPTIVRDGNVRRSPWAAEETPTTSRNELSVKNIRQLQVRALESQIQANEAVVRTCSNINKVLIPNILAKLGTNPDVMKDFL